MQYNVLCVPVESYHFTYLYKDERNPRVVSTEEMVSVNVHLCMASRTHLSFKGS